MSERTLIAVVDDEPVWLAAVGRGLSREGYHAQLIGDPEAAVSLVREEKPSVVILDRWMPQLSGLELAEQLKSELGDACPALVLVTGDLVDVTPSQLARFDAIFEKPVSLKVLLRTVRRLVRGQKSSGTVRVADAPAHETEATKKQA